MTRDELNQYDLPDAPGVYVFRDAKRKILYIGKATSLMSRVRSYFASDLVSARGARIVKMVELAKELTWEETDSVLEALILEASLIKKHQPPYNVDEKDNKSWNYVVITKEEFPRVLTVRGRELFLNWDMKKDVKHLFGPFPHGMQLKEAMKIVRKIFPYRDKCTPNAGKPCFNAQLGLCPGVCSGVVDAKEYARTIRHLVLFFSGKKKALLAALEREMKAAAKREDFEAAARLRRQISALSHINDVALIKRDTHSTGGVGVRIEGYDIAHISGTDTVGVMTVVLDGVVARGELRRFRVRDATNDDPKALSEIVSRRLAHPEWPLPRVFAIDGGKLQVRAVERVLKAAGVQIPIVGIVKDEKHRPKQLIGPAAVIKEHEKEILLANDEAHKRAVAYLHTRQRKRMV